MAKREKEKEYPITIWMTEQQYNDIKAYCYKYDLTISQVGRCAIKKYITDK